MVRRLGWGLGGVGGRGQMKGKGMDNFDMVSNDNSGLR